MNFLPIIHAPIHAPVSSHKEFLFHHLPARGNKIRNPIFGKRLLPFIFLLFFIVLLSGCGKLKGGKSEESLAQSRLEVSEVVLQTKEKEILLEVEIANEPLERELGLMYRESLLTRKTDDVQSGMLFIFPYEESLKFWMRNTKIELDIIFIDADRKIVGIVENAKPCKEDPCETYGPDASSKAVLELPGGFAEEQGIAVGDSLELTLTPPSPSFDTFNPL